MKAKKGLVLIAVMTLILLFSLIAYAEGPGIVLTKKGKIKVTLTQASAALVSQVWLSEPEEFLLIDNNLKNVGTVIEKEYPAGTNFNFFIRTDGTPWKLGVYDHYADSKFAKIQNTGDNKWQISFEDLPEERADWDYNDAVLLVELFEEKEDALPNPMPSLSLEPDDMEACINEASIIVRNTGDEKKDDAKNVKISITAIKNAQLVKEIVYNPNVGDIPENSAKVIPYKLVMANDWASQPLNTEVKVEIKVTNEDNRPAHNIGKTAHYTLVRSNDEGCYIGACTEEICDGVDNDCDGQIDEQLTMQCGETDTGVCEFGTKTCKEGSWGTCQGAVNPDIEICNNIDDDCDGKTDEELSQSCGTDAGICHTGTQICSSGKWSECGGEYIPPAEEYCDAVDNNCDGKIDEGCECKDRETRECGSSTGICSAGMQACKKGKWGICEGQVSPEEEVCDNLDNDCDGKADEDLIRSCGYYFVGACSQGKQTCESGEWSECSEEIKPVIEICDDIDNDCDGNTDESVTQSCGVSDIGTCKFGVKTCSNGKFGECAGNIDPVVEICDNNLDDDCDGNVDESCETAPPACEPEEEVCDGLDNDCDGNIDEDLTRSCGNNAGACSVGTETCSEGVWGACIGAVGPDEEVCDNIDNDCDGKVDEGVTQSCGSDIGACQQGVQICAEGVFGECVDNIEPEFEICDGIDDDCDGLIDNGIECSCSNGETQSCGSDIGACQLGTQNCVDGQFGACVGYVEPLAEVCDNIDNDCDGNTDENITELCGVSDVGACRFGVKTCSNGEMSECVGDIGPASEACGDNIDNDCDGLVDETCISTAPRKAGGKGGDGGGQRHSNVPVSLARALETTKTLEKAQYPKLIVTATNYPEVADITDGVLSIQAVAKNAGHIDLTGVNVEASSSVGFGEDDVFIGSLAPGQEKEFIVTLKNMLCSLERKEKSITFGETGMAVKLHGTTEQEVTDDDEVNISFFMPEFAVRAAQNSFKDDNRLKACFFVNNFGKEERSKLEIEYELADNQDDVLVDFFRVKAPADKLLVVVKDHNINYIPRQKAYELRGILYENGTLFKDGYLSGEDSTSVDFRMLKGKKSFFADIMDKMDELLG